MGADDGWLISGAVFGGADVLATSYTLAQALQAAGGYDIIICGRQTTDGDTSQVGPSLAAQLGIAQVSWVEKIEEIGTQSIVVRQHLGDRLLVVRAAYPCLLAVERDIFVPRLPTLKGRLAAKKKAARHLGLANFADQDAAHYGLAGSATQVERIFPPDRAVRNKVLRGVMIGAEAQINAARLAGYPLRYVYTYAAEQYRYFRAGVYAAALEDCIERIRPAVVLVGGTPVGRILAPYAAAAFQTGITADCTQLEMRPNTDLVQIRPAFGGNIMAQIVTRNARPQFATVRCNVMRQPVLRPDMHPSFVHCQAAKKENKSEMLTVLREIALPKERDIADEKVLVAAECKIVYVLFGDICTIGSIVQRIKDMGKVVILHVDLINGFANKEICIDYLKEHTKVDGIISTKPFLVKRASEVGLFAIQRFWMIDALTYANVKKHVKMNKPDVVELMSAGLPKVIRYLCEDIDTPVVASGLVLDKDDVYGLFLLKGQERDRYRRIFRFLELVLSRRYPGLYHGAGD